MLILDICAQTIETHKRELGYSRGRDRKVNIRLLDINVQVIAQNPLNQSNVIDHMLP